MTNRWPRRPLTENEKAAILAGVGGLLMLTSGATGASQWRHTFALVDEIFGQTPVIRVLGLIFVALGSVGGIFVLMGAHAFREDRVRTGRFMLWLGTGFTVFSVILFLILEFRRGDLTFAGGTLLGAAGIMLTIVARVKARALPTDRPPRA